MKRQILILSAIALLIGGVAIGALAYDPETAETITGKVKELNIQPPHPYFVVETDAGEVIEVEVGPMRHWDLELKVGDTVELKGEKWYREVAGEKEIEFRPYEVKVGDKTLQFFNESGSPTWAGDRQGRLFQEHKNSDNRQGRLSQDCECSGSRQGRLFQERENSDNRQGKSSQERKDSGSRGRFHQGPNAQ